MTRERNRPQDPPRHALPHDHRHTLTLELTSEEIASLVDMADVGFRARQLEPAGRWAPIEVLVWARLTDAILSAAGIADVLLHPDRERKGQSDKERDLETFRREEYMRAAKTGRLRYGATKPRTTNWSSQAGGDTR